MLFQLIYSSFASFVPYALKGQKLLAQGIALGMMAISKTPCKGKSFMFCLEFHIEGLVENGEDVPEWLKNGDYEFEYNIIR